MSASILWDLNEQGSDAWLQARRGVITGSRAKDARDRLADVPAKPQKVDKATGEILQHAQAARRGDFSAKAKLYAQDLARERVGGTVAPMFQNAAMRFGSEQEEHARRAYMLHSGHLVEERGFAYTADRKFGVSIDGDPDPQGLWECKTMVSSGTLFTAYVDGDISEYRDQCLMAMWLLHRQWCDLTLWAPDLQANPMRVIRIERDEDEIQRLVDDLLDFDALVESYRTKLAALLGNGEPLPERQAEPEPEPEEPAAAPAPIPAPAPAVHVVKPGAIPADIF